MYLSRKKIKRLLHIKNQTQRAIKKREGGLKKHLRTLRRKKPVNLRNRTIKSYGNKTGGSDVSQIEMETDISLKENKETREAIETKKKEDETVKKSELMKYTISKGSPGYNKIEKHLKMLSKRVEAISKNIEEAEQRRDILQLVLKDLKTAQREKKEVGVNISDEQKRVGGARIRMDGMLQQFKNIKAQFENDLKKIIEYKGKNEYYEYTEPKSRIKFYSKTIGGFDKYNERAGVLINFPTYTGAPFYSEGDFAGDDLIKTLKNAANKKGGIFASNKQSESMQRLIDYKDKRGDLLIKSDEMDAAQSAESLDDYEGIRAENERNKGSQGVANIDQDNIEAQQDNMAGNAVTAGRTRAPVQGGARSRASLSATAVNINRDKLLDRSDSGSTNQFAAAPQFGQPQYGGPQMYTVQRDDAATIDAKAAAEQGGLTAAIGVES